jgi:hypothetical protein
MIAPSIVSRARADPAADESAAISSVHSASSGFDLARPVGDASAESEAHSTGQRPAEDRDGGQQQSDERCGCPSSRRARRRRCTS